MLAKYSLLKNKHSKAIEDNKVLRNSINALEYKNQVYNVISKEEMENGKNSNLKVNFYQDLDEKSISKH